MYQLVRKKLLLVDKKAHTRPLAKNSRKGTMKLKKS